MHAVRPVSLERQALDLAIVVGRATHLMIEAGDPVWSDWIEQVRRLPFHLPGIAEVLFGAKCGRIQFRGTSHLTPR
jgi:hypothetical protein